MSPMPPRTAAVLAALGTEPQTITALCAATRMQQHTVREALGKLVAGGFVVRWPSSGKAGATYRRA